MYDAGSHVSGELQSPSCSPSPQKANATAAKARTPKQQACAASVAASVGGVSLLAIGGSSLALGLVPEPATPALLTFGTVAGAAGGIFAFGGYLDEKAFCD